MLFASYEGEEFAGTERGRALLQEAARALHRVYSQNVFPDLNITWGTYPDHLGHRDFPGCFRCHDEEHATEDGEYISQDCDTCHILLAEEEDDPEALEALFPEF
jgi:hypothetical protein